jgi:hypothetical protein
MQLGPGLEGSRRVNHKRVSSAPFREGAVTLSQGSSLTTAGLFAGIAGIELGLEQAGHQTDLFGRIDLELRAEASDYHVRQPWSVMVGVLFLPWAAVSDGKPTQGANSPSSFGHAVKYFRQRVGRKEPHDDPQLFELFFVTVYRHDPDHFGEAIFFDVRDSPPPHGPPENGQDLNGFAATVRETFDLRNDVPFEWG